MAATLVHRKPQQQPAQSEAPTASSETKLGPHPSEAPQRSSLSSWLLGAILVIVTATGCLYFLRILVREPEGPVVFDNDRLAQYNGKNGAPFYLVILGEVFDVTKGRRHYDGEKGYACFIGRDSTRAFITGDFEGDLTDDVSDFTPEQLKGLVEWRSFYQKEYTYKGRLVGRFYDARGRPTSALREVEDKAAQAKSEEELQREMEAQWPACNVRWTQAEGGEVWCDEGMYPRKVTSTLPGGKQTTRCACFKEIGWSDIRQVYPNCAPDVSRCSV